MIVFFTFAFSVVSFGAEPRVSYSGYRQAQLTVATKDQLDTLERLGVKILNCHIGHGPLQIIATAGQLDELTRLGIQFQIQVADVEESLSRQSATNAQRAAALGTADPFNDFFLDYRDYTDTAGGIIWYMNELVTRYPNLAEIVNVGTTLQGRTIFGIKVTNLATTNKPAVVYFGAEHAREWIATTMSTYFANSLLSNYGTDPAVTDLLDNVEFYLVPVFNVDGYIYTRTTDRFWRKNRRNNGDGTFGVDINRNWGAGWGGEGSSGSGSQETYRGTAPFSEPET
jgi:murein tripeptide amidase MpaA